MTWQRAERSVVLALALSLILVVGWTSGGAAQDEAVEVPPENSPRLCQNQIDDDGDGLIDCADDGCARLIFCVGAQTAEPEPVEVSPTQDGLPGTRGIYAPRIVERGPEVEFEEHDDPRDYAQSFVLRPMTYLSGMLVPTVGFSLRDTTGGGLTQLGLGVSYGILDILQISALAVPLRLSPTFDYENPAISITLRVYQHEVVEIGIYGNVAIPVGTNNLVGFPEPLPAQHFLARSRYSSVTHLDLALLLRFHLSEYARIDLTLPVVAMVLDLDPMPGTTGFHADLTFDARVAFQITEYAYAGLFSGVVIPGPSYADPKIPFGFFAGASIPGADRGPVADIGIRFGWPLFYDSSVGDVSGDNWQLTIDTRVFTYLLP